MSLFQNPNLSPSELLAFKKILLPLSKKLSVRYELITTLLLNDKDCLDVGSGVIEISSLECHIGAWRDNGMHDLVFRKKILESENVKWVDIKKLRPPFISN